ncbi:carboxypeptidase-like regulatory domain-containing protein [Hymenobacter sp. B81]|uniref:carboxypeptidase-like regulatory domain-containing protein n=1 Tax=Hymenobacter sp. B81 TaxID=3344878 RepID=UPI0037DD78B4
MNDNYEPSNVPEEQLDTEEESLDSGNRKLALVFGAILLLGGLGFALVPAQNRERIANGQMPTFELAEATVVGSRPADEAAAPAATEAEQTAAAAAVTAAAAGKPVAVATAARPARPGNEAAAPVPTAATAAAEAGEAGAATEAAAAPAPVEEEAAPRVATLSGRVLDENGRPLAGATIMVKGTRKFASTDQNGNYSVEVPSGENSLVYGYGGYADQEIRTRSGQPANVTLVPSDNGGRRKRR